MTIRLDPIHLVKGLFFFLAVLCVPWALKEPSGGLDGSWMAVLSHAYENGWQFGKDLVFSFGPYGFLYTSLYQPQTYAITLAFWSFYAIALASSVALLMRKQHMTAACMLLLVLLLGTRVPDAALFLVPLLLLFAYAARVRVLVPPLLALTALIALIKFTFAMLGFAMILLIEAHRMFRRRHIPYYLLSYLGLSLLFFVMAGQEAGNFTRFISTSLAVAQGYGDAMQLAGPVGDVICFFGLAACFIGLVAHVAMQRQCLPAPDRGILVTLGLCLFTYVIMKAGFVRHDKYHSVIAWAALSAGIAVYSIVVLPNVARPRTRTALLALCALSAIATLIRTTQVERPFSLHQSFVQGFLERAVAIVGLLRGEYREHQASRNTTAWETIRADHPLPVLTGTVDIYPWDQSALIAHRLEYRPRPVFQSYHAYNRSLIELNRDHFQGGRSATYLLFDARAIDGRLPAMEGGPLWRDIIAHYEPHDRTHRDLVLRKRDKARKVRLVPISKRSTTWSDAVQVPKDVTPVWISLEMRKTVLGSLVSVLYKLPPMRLRLSVEDGSAHVLKIVPAVAREGFVLSPLVNTGAQFAQLFDPAAWPSMQRRVLQIDLVGYSGVRWFYHEEIEVRFAHLCIEPCGLSQAAPEQTDRVSEPS